jgi:hypothetical protein
VVDDDFERRAAARRNWPVRRYTLGGEPSEDLSATTSINERLDMMWQLALDAWASTGKPLPSYERSQMPGRILRRANGEPPDRTSSTE